MRIPETCYTKKVKSQKLKKNNTYKLKATMEIIGRIIYVSSMNERQYQDKRTGQMQTFRSVTVKIQRGPDLIAAEAVQEQAVRLSEAAVRQEVQPDVLLCLRLAFWSEEYADKNGEVRYKTSVGLRDWERV